MKNYTDREQIMANSYRQSLSPQDQIAILETAIKKHESYIDAKKQYDTLNYQFSQLKPKLPPDKPEDPDSPDEEDDEEDIEEYTPASKPQLNISKTVIFSIASIVIGANLIPVLPEQGISLIIVGIIILILRKLGKKLEEKRNSEAYIAAYDEERENYKQELAQWELDVKEIQEWNNSLPEKRNYFTNVLLPPVKQKFEDAVKDFVAYIKKYSLTFVDYEYNLCAIDVRVLRRMLQHMKNGDAYSMEDAIYLCNQDTHDFVVYSGMHLEIVNVELQDRALHQAIQEQREQDAKQAMEKEKERQDGALQDAQAKQQEELERIRKDLDNIDLLKTLEYIEHTKNNS